jgi:hypothetical protein
MKGRILLAVMQGIQAKCVGQPSQLATISPRLTVPVDQVGASRCVEIRQIVADSQMALTCTALLVPRE